ncbi:LysR family transcriptional regulator, partial [Klebsiella variicola]|nr:LysR family transcriptional regulator [Klebsiella variicola]
MRQVFVNKSMGLRDLWSGGDFPSPAPNSKLQTPNSKLQTPNSKLQTPNSKLQTPNSKLQTPV